MSFLDALDPRYRVILCDIWGCVHDGVHLYPGAAERLCRWRSDGRKVVLLSNAPRNVEVIEEQLQRIGVPRQCWDAVMTSGEAGIAALKELGRPVGFLGTASDRSVLERKGVEIANGEEFTDLACTGLDERRRSVDDYQLQLRSWAERSIVMHCLNPDRIVISGGAMVPCAGALADLYEAFGGRVCWYGKPHEPIYREALHLVGDPPASEVLAIGDGIHTDIVGAARMGFDAVFVSGGIHAGEPFPENFGRENGLGDWHPVAIVPALA